MVLASTFAWFIVSSTTAYGNVMFLHREKNASVEIPCEFPNITKNDILIAFALFRRQNRSREVLYHNFNSPPDVKARISVQNCPKNHKVSVNITNLQENDTDIYWCVFYYNIETRVNIPTNGSTTFFLYVEAPQQCSCSNLLLYALSAAALLLFFFVLILTGAYFKKPTVQPVYEDMRRVCSPNRPKD